MLKKLISKSLLNNLLSTFGLSITKLIIEIVNPEEFNKILQTREVKGYKQIDDMILSTYDPSISREICE